MKSDKYYIGVAATFHDPSIAIMDGSGELIYAESTERYLQTKRAMGCIADQANWIDKVINEFCNPQAEFHIATNWSMSYKKTLRTLSFLGLLDKEPAGVVGYIFNKVVKSMLRDENLMWFLRNQCASLTHAGANAERYLKWELKNHKIKRYSFNHHESHAASAVYASGMESATCVVIDGIGEQGSVSYFSYQEGSLKQIGHHKGYESLGFFYTLITYLCGFNAIEGEEWKVMGMAPYGGKNDFFYDQLNSILQIKDCSVQFKKDPKTIASVIQNIKEALNASSNSFSLRADLAYTGQLLFSEYTIRLLHNIHKKGTSDNLVYAGGCALNSSFNGQITVSTPFKNLYVPSAPGDDGTSVGAAYLALLKNNKGIFRQQQKIQSPYLGSVIDDAEIEQFIKYSGYQLIQHCPGRVCEETAALLAAGALVGWVQGKAEFGPRALGNRSILADPRSPDMKDIINSRVKFREEFRPFAPSILAEYGDEYFENYQESPYMERTLVFKEAVVDKVPAVVHENRTGRLQTVKREWNERYYDLISEFHKISGVPLLLNTSFNVMGKPIIHTFKDALTVFFNSGLDVLVVNDYILKK
jgi:carbamoyltransferase